MIKCEICEKEFKDAQELVGHRCVKHKELSKPFQEINVHKRVSSPYSFRVTPFPGI